MIKRLLFFSFVMLLFVSNTNLFAQTTQASISGVVTDEQNKPIPGVAITVRNESTGFTTKTGTNNQGAYTFKELPLGGPYTVKAVFIGFGEQTRSGYNLNLGDLVKVNIKMTEGSQTLLAVEINGNGLKNKSQQFGASTEISSKTMNQLPINGRNFSSLTDLSPLSNGGSISGQLGSSTNFTIDGMTAKNPTSAGSTTSRSGAPYSISIETVREFKVVTNQYDVTLGRAGGGTISAVTKAGTNQITGSAFGYTRADWLSSPNDIRGNKRVNDFSTSQYGFTLGGPIIKDKLHYFVGWDHQRDARPLIIADINSEADEARFNITNATLSQFLGIAREKYGVANTPQYGSFNKRRGSDAAFARLDYQINDKNLLTVRDNYTNDRNPLGLADNTAINFLESYGNDKNVDNSLLATLRTTVNSKITNELKVQHLYTYQASTQGDQLNFDIPRAVVGNIASTIAGVNRTTAIQIGGHRFAQEGFTNNVLQVINNFYYNTDKIKYTFGFDAMYTNALSLYGSEVNGRFTFTNNTGTALQDFENLRPVSFYREVPLVEDPSVRANIWNTAIYGQMQTKLGLGLDFTGGLRLDYSSYPKSPLNQELFNAIGVRTDNELKQLVLQPRIQFDWNINEKNTDYLRFGAGIFGSDVNNYVTINNLSFDGKHFATVDVFGADVPTPNFAGYRNGTVGSPTLAAFQVPTINTYAEDAKLPVVYKANLSYSKLINQKLRVGITGYATLARNNYMYVDRNMVANPFFTLANEGNRGVFVPSIPSGAVADWKTGRLTNQFGRVLELNSKGKVNQFAVVVDGTWQYFKDGEISASYTWNDSKDNTSFNGNVANSATLSLPVVSDPRDLSNITYSNGQFRHKVVIYGTLPTFYGIKIGFKYSGIGGTRYSLLSGANNNGDFVTTNDLAYIFDRNNTNVPDRVRNGLQALLDNPLASQSIKDYILKYEGTFAERNGGINNFFGQVDLRVSKKVNITKRQNIEVSADFFNFANLLSKKWGVTETLGTQALYGLGVPAAGTTAAIPNYDTTNRQFNYRINNTGVVNPSGNPWQIQLGLRYGF